MTDVQRWEYAIIFRSPDPTIRVTYTVEGDIDEEELPHNVIDMTLGDLGYKGWELVSVATMESSSIGRITEYYFKRPHDPNRGLRE